MAWKEYCGFKELQESMGRCTGCCNTTEILLKMALSTMQSINPVTKLTKFLNVSYISCNILPYIAPLPIWYPLSSMSMYFDNLGFYVSKW